jgi:chromosomal replication initiator protein
MRQEVTRDEKDIVSELRRGLSERIGRERFSLWFGTGVTFAVRDGVLLVYGRDQFVADRLRKQFSRDLAAIATDVVGGGTTVRFLVDGAIKQPPDTESVDPPREVRRAGDEGEPASVVSLRSASRAGRRYATLDSFVVGDGNRIALTAARSVTRQVGVVSPLFLHGPSGSGKTHLLEGIWSDLRGRRQVSRAVLLSAEQFTTHFLEALRGSGLPSFRHKVREVELLAIDDLQFFVGKRATLVELQHTIDALLRSGRQLVLAADRPPAELRGLGPELVGRVAGGLVCGIEPAEYAVRLRIARQLAARRAVEFPEKVLELVASELVGDARQIAGALNRLQATSQALGEPPTVDLAARALDDVFRATRRVVHLPDIEKAVCDVFGLESKSLRNGRKAKAISHPRMLAMWLARKHTPAAFSEISQFFGRRSHSTVISAQRKVQRWMADGAKIQVGQGCCHIDEAIRRVETQLRSG